MITELSARFTSPSTAIVAGEVLGSRGWETVLAEYECEDDRWGCTQGPDRREHQAACDRELLGLLERCAMDAAEIAAEAAE